MEKFIKKLLRESLLGEEYPKSFDMDVFKSLSSFNKRIKYCEQNLTRISSGSARIVYKIDDEKVLKLAKNKKGLAQNEIEIDYSKYNDLQDILAKVFDYDEHNLWSEMELAKKVKVSDFKKIIGYDWNDYVGALYRYFESYNHKSKGYSFTNHLKDDKLYDEMWENEFIYDIFQFMGNYDLPVGDLVRKNSYGVVSRGGKDYIVIIDYGLTKEVYGSYYN